ncbi:MAG: hypothetical protein QOJ38_1167 [Solirubrobacterales bacterium]|nr:hypothetical protein [Solirubrobacterales bacterium]
MCNAQPPPGKGKIEDIGASIGLAVGRAKVLGVGDDEQSMEEPGFRERLSQRSEEALGDVAQALLDNPLFSQAVHAASGARERALAARRTAMGALDVPAASDVDRLERRLRSLADRVEELENAIDSLTAPRRASRQAQPKPEV